MSQYHPMPGGHPEQRELMTNRACFHNAYALIPRGVMRDIVTSALPHWDRSRFWVLARPMSGFSETFSHYLSEVSPGGGSDTPENDSRAQSALFVISGEITVTIDGAAHTLTAGGFAFVPAGVPWSLRNNGSEAAGFHWVRKLWQQIEGVERPPVVVSTDATAAGSSMAGTDGVWSTKRFLDPEDMRFDFHVNIVTFLPGGCIPFEETHVMEHGLFVLEGKGVYKLNTEWHEVEAGDFMWLRAYCPQACYASGPEPFRYLLYKDVNRHVSLGPVVGA